MDPNIFIDPSALEVIRIEHKSVEVVALGSLGKDLFEEPLVEWIVKAYWRSYTKNTKVNIRVRNKATSIPRYSLSCYYPESDSDSWLESGFPAIEIGTCWRWDEEDREGL